MRRAWFLGLTLMAACSPTTAVDAGTDTPDSGPAAAAECTAIVEACHPVDPGTGPISDCHEYAEMSGRTAAECMSMSASCLALCHAAADAGADTGTTRDTGSATDTGRAD